jgi:phosphohistidine phosphatase
MKLYLVQHAKAVSKDVDPKRPLTDEGHRDIQKVAGFIEALNLKVDSLWHSGKTRAAQTADVLSEVVQVRTETAERNGLAPNDDVEAMKDELVASDRDVMIVGHMPFVSKLTSLLLADDKSAGVVAFRQSGIVALEQRAEDQWQINWILVPELLV